MTTAEIAGTLAGVIDPELGISIVALGLIYAIHFDDEAVHVELTLTSIECPMGEVIAGMAAARLNRDAEGRRVELEVVTEPPWQIQMADAAAQRELGLVPV